MIKTIWFAIIGLAAVGVIVGIKVGAASLASADMPLAEITTVEQTTSTKADKLGMLNIGPASDKAVVMPITIVPQKTKSDQTQSAITIVNRHWHDPLAPKTKPVSDRSKERSLNPQHLNNLAAYLFGNCRSQNTLPRQGETRSAVLPLR